MYYKIADIIVKMKPKHKPLIDQISFYKLDYIPKQIDCTIPEKEEAIIRYQKKHPQLSIGEAEYLLYGAYFYNTLLSHQGIFLHSSCVVYEGLAYLFSADSGVGKSTHTSLWKKVFPSSFILNDDKPALKFDGDNLYAYGTPFSGKTNQNVNARYPVGGIAYIYRSKTNEAKEISTKEILIYFLRQTLKPHQESSFDLMAKTLDRIVNKTKFFYLGLNMEDEAALFTYNIMKQGKA